MKACLLADLERKGFKLYPRGNNMFLVWYRGRRLGERRMSERELAFHSRAGQGRRFAGFFKRLDRRKNRRMGKIFN